MHRIKLAIYIFLLLVISFSCSKKNAGEATTPDIINNKEPNKNTDPISPNVNNNIEEIIADLHNEIKILQAELSYQNDGINKIEAQSQLWADPFSIYNKEIVLNNGSSIFGKIIYQDENVMTVETLIGQLMIERNTISRVINQINSYNKLNLQNTKIDAGKIDYDNIASGPNIINKHKYSESAQLALIGNIKEIKDSSGNTVLSGEIKNIGNKRADFAKIIFSFRMDWQGTTKTLTAFIKGVTNTFDTGISSDNSIPAHAIGNFELIIPNSFGAFIGYNYDFDWSQYDK